jgi:hypothetical protein
MDAVPHYRQILIAVLTDYYATTATAPGGLNRQLILDPDRDQYLVMMVGWEQQQRIAGCVLHVDLIDGQIWIQQDRTEYGIADALVAHGIPKDAIVLGFHPPYKRPYTGFGVGHEPPDSHAA